MFDRYVTLVVWYNMLLVVDSAPRVHMVIATGSYISGRDYRPIG
jgi:hypothetical protein